MWQSKAQNGSFLIEIVAVNGAGTVLLSRNKLVNSVKDIHFTVFLVHNIALKNGLNYVYFPALAS